LALTELHLLMPASNLDLSCSDVLQQTLLKFISSMSNSKVKSNGKNLRIPVLFRNPIKAGKHDGKYNI